MTGAPQSGVPQSTENAARPSPGGHTPVMLREVLAALSPRDGAIYLDGTFGAGGYAEAILDAADCRVWGIDRDPAAVTRGQAMARRYGERLTVIQGRFGVMDRLLGEREVTAVDGIALDIGVSSMQIEDAERGFSFRADGPLDMRMTPEGEDAGPSAAEVVNDLPEAELAEVISRYGEERRARQVARAIVTARHEHPIERTARLAEIVRKAVRRGVKGRRPARSRRCASTSTTSWASSTAACTPPSACSLPAGGSPSSASIRSRTGRSSLSCASARAPAHAARATGPRARRPSAATRLSGPSPGALAGPAGLNARPIRGPARPG